MELRDALRRRRMTRAFSGAPLDERRLSRLCVEALRAPTAGHARGVEMVVLAGPSGVDAYLATATDPAWRAGGRASGLARAGGAVLVLCDPGRYAARYAEPDKAGSGLGDPGAWPVPYWYGDAAFATMALLLLAEDDGLGACFLGAFRNEDAVCSLVDAPTGVRLFGAVLLGERADDDHRSASLERPGPTRAARVGLGAYPASATG